MNSRRLFIIAMLLAWCSAWWGPQAGAQDLLSNPDDVEKALQKLLNKRSQPLASGTQDRKPMESHKVIQFDPSKDLRILAAPPSNLAMEPVVRQRPVDAPHVDVQINFEINSHELVGTALQLLDRVAKVMSEPGREPCRISVNGHTDSKTGSYPHNMRLSGLRALSVVRYLVQQRGIPVTRFEARGYGPNKPAYPETTQQGIERNRRVEFELLDSR
ncbi:MAG: OmpA family protein [Candidatus Riflebacteria bacterium]|nr:OmpA family protein [Candidatus Riflebacteria bacterium]